MRLSKEGIDLVKRSEGLRTYPYICPAGFWTIGYGSIWQLDGKRVTAATPLLTREEAEALLVRCVAETEDGVARLIRVPLTQGQFDALADFTFNLGAGNLQASVLRSVINQRRYDEAPRQFRRWVHGGGRVLSMLVRRREDDIVLWNYETAGY